MHDHLTNTKPQLTVVVYSGSIPITLVLGISLLVLSVEAQKKKIGTNQEDQYYLEKIGINGLRFRSVGPALTSGRIADFAVHPQQADTCYYIATSSGGVWKTDDAGTTFQPIFDQESSYSIGCISIDPNNFNINWVGCGENNNLRSVYYDNGVYKSESGTINGGLRPQALRLGADGPSPAGLRHDASAG